MQDNRITLIRLRQIIKRLLKRRPVRRKLNFIQIVFRRHDFFPAK